MDVASTFVMGDVKASSSAQAASVSGATATASALPSDATSPGGSTVTTYGAIGSGAGKTVTICKISQHKTLA
jgi:hypothetical protein